MKFLICLFVLILAACGGGGGDNSSESNTKSFQYNSSVSHWQTYSASPQGAIHYWNNESQEYEIYKLKRINEEFRTGYGFVNSTGDLIFDNRASGEKFKYTNNSFSKDSSSGNYFEYGGRFFYSSGSTIYACNLKSKNECIGIEIKEGTFPYVFAEANANVLAVTNWGDALKFNETGWCRMSRSSEDIFVCDPNEPMVIEPRAVQFYSSIKYQRETLVGEWPTGSIYTFDGKTLKPSVNWTPPPMRSREKVGYEAQSMAEYCGDLFVGYWPKGELWKYSREKNQWKFFKRFFSGGGDSSVIPWFNRPQDEADPAFYGQRITALVPFDSSLYVVTSNLRSWDGGIFADHLLPNELDEYGSIYEIKGKDCLTVYLSNDKK